MKPDQLLFGTAGIPIGTSSEGGDTVQGVKDVNELGLAAMELEFVRSVYVSKEKAPLIKKAAEQSNVVLTCHAPYFINLNSLDKAKLNASKERILNSARILNMCGGWSVCFHPGFYMKEDPKKVYEKIKNEIQEIAKTLKDEGNPIWIRPETTGKGSQFGSIKELLKVSEEVENVMPCIDFSHLHARSNGKENTFEEFRTTLSNVEKSLGKEGLENMHIHLSGIDYGEKGEKKHLILKESDMNYKDLLTALKEFKAKGVVVCESPNIEKDALLLKQTFQKR